MTSLKEERKEQKRWKLKPAYKGTTIFGAMIDEEFLSEDELSNRQSRALAGITSFASGYVPYYKELFSQLSMEPDAVKSVDDLRQLPILTKEDLLEKEKSLIATALPKNESVYGYSSSSGTTGRPVRVLMTKTSNMMFSFLAVRQYRWFKFDPRETIAYVRATSAIQGHGVENSSKAKLTFRKDRWNYVGQFFETGPSIAMSNTTTLEEQVQWMEENKPGHLVTYPSVLEEYAFARNDGPPVDSIKSVLGISAQMTPGMRAKIEQSFGVPVNQCYGLNEVGLVAIRCEAGRYHVHAGHCIVEIVDDEGMQCKPGETGRIIVTGLSNLAMPLIRYDTDDMAEVTEGPCPCGRTLPSFGEITGRYRRWRGLPEGSRKKYRVIREAFESLPNDILIDVRRFQVHQYKNNTFELRVVSKVPLSNELVDRMMKQWHQKHGEVDTSLTVVQVESIMPGRGGKLAEFTSDYFS